MSASSEQLPLGDAVERSTSSGGAGDHAFGAGVAAGVAAGAAAGAAAESLAAGSLARAKADADGHGSAGPEDDTESIAPSQAGSQAPSNDIIFFVDDGMVGVKMTKHGRTARRLHIRGVQAMKTWCKCASVQDVLTKTPR